MASTQRKNLSRSISTGQINKGYATESRGTKQSMKNAGSPTKKRDTSVKVTSNSVETQLKQLYRVVMGKELASSSLLTGARETLKTVQDCVKRMKLTIPEFTDTYSFTEILENVLQEYEKIKNELQEKEAYLETSKTFYSEKLKEAKNEVQIKILDLESSKQDNEELRKRMLTFQTKITDYESRMSQNQRDLRALQEEKQTVSEEMQRCLKNIQKLDEEKKGQTEKLTILENENQKLKEELKSLKIRIHNKNLNLPEEKGRCHCKVQSWILTHPPEDIDSDHDGISRPFSGISAGAITSISHTATDYSHRPVSSRSVRFSCANSDTLTNNSQLRPKSCGSTGTYFSCANSESTILTQNSKPSEKNMLRRLSKDTEISFANSNLSKKK